MTSNFFILCPTREIKRPYRKKGHGHASFFAEQLIPENGVQD